MFPGTHHWSLSWVKWPVLNLKPYFFARMIYHVNLKGLSLKQLAVSICY
jgi:hypothetical protein